MKIVGGLSWLGQMLAWVVILGISAVLVSAVLVPRVAGATPYTILTGSMEPQYPPGTLVVVKPVPADEVGVGSVITYQLRSGRSAVVTHRVVAVATTLTGDRTFTTRGDANDVDDAAPVRPVQVKGAVWYSVPYLGYGNELLSGGQRQVAVLVVAGGLLAYAAWMFLMAARNRAAARESKTSREEVHAP